MLRNLLRETIFIRLCIFFIFGIILYEYTNEHISLNILILLSFSSIISISIYYLLIHRYNITFKLYNGALVFICIIQLALLIAYFNDARNNPNYLKILNKQQHILKISSQGKIKNGFVSYNAKLMLLGDEISNVLLSIKQKQINYHLNDTLEINAKLIYIEKQRHPAAFNYQNYLVHKGIYHQFRIDSNQVLNHYPSNTFSIQGLSNVFKAKLIHILQSNISDTGSFEMATALLLGERAEIDKELLKSYTDTGTIHIISVSGLHVGIIFLVLQFILKKLIRTKYELPRTVLIICFIWIYAILTGLPASVIRSALMISLLCIGKAINNKSNSINHVAASALIILSYDPNYLFDVGFQLSYLAVLGIMYLQKPIENLFISKNKLLHYLWITSSVSISAQLFTLPFCMYYFHQFPNYFVLANLFAIPLSSFALYAAIANLLFAQIPYLNTISEWCISTSINYLNNYLMFLAKLPGAVSKTEMWTLTESIFLALFIFFVLLLWVEKIRVSLKFGILTIICWTLFHMYQKENHEHMHLWVIHHKFQRNFSIEYPDSLVHFYQLKEDSQMIEKNIALWNSISTKVQINKKLKQNSFILSINGQKWNSKTIDSNYKSNPYKRICL